MVDSVNVIGRGRVGSALGARLRERGVELRDGGAELVLLCVPDRAIAEVAAGIEPGPVGRARQRRDAARRARSARAPLLAAPAADVHARPGARAARRRLGGGHRRDRRGAGARPGAGRPPSACGRSTWPTTSAILYHAGAAIASNYLVTLYRAASRLFEDAGRAAGGARAADDPHDRERLPAHRPDRAQRLGGGRCAHRRAARERDRSSSRCTGCWRRRPRREDHAHRSRRPARRWPTGEVGLVPTMGAYHAGHLSLFAAAREENDLVVASLFVNPAQFGDPADLARYPRDEAADAAIAEEAGVDVLFAPPLEELYPPGYETWVDVDRGVARPRRRVPPRPLPGRRDDLPQALQHRPSPARVLRAEGRAAGRGAPPDDPRPEPRPRAPRAADGARRRRPRALLAERAPRARGARGGTRPPARARDRRPGRRRAHCSTVSTSTTSRSLRSTHPRSPPRSASAPSA